MPPPRSSKVQQNPWGDPKAAIVGGPTAKGAAPRVAASGPAEKPPTPAAPTRMRYNMAAGK